MEYILYIIGFLLIIWGLLAYRSYRDEQDLKWYLKMKMAERGMLYEAIESSCMSVDNAQDGVMAKKTPCFCDVEYCDGLKNSLKYKIRTFEIGGEALKDF